MLLTGINNINPKQAKSHLTLQFNTQIKHHMFVFWDDNCVTLGHHIAVNSCHDLARRHGNDCLAPDQSQLAIFHDLCDTAQLIQDQLTAWQLMFMWEYSITCIDVREVMSHLQVKWRWWCSVLLLVNIPYCDIIQLVKLGEEREKQDYRYTALLAAL